VELDLESAKYERYALDQIYKPKDASMVEQLFRQTPCGQQLLDGGSAPGSTTSGEASSRAVGEDDIPFRHGPDEGAAARLALLIEEAAVANDAKVVGATTPACFGLELRRRPECPACPVQEGCEERFVEVMSARSAARKASSERD